MKKTLFLTLSFATVLGLVANEKCEAKKAIQETHAQHEATEHEAQTIIHEAPLKATCTKPCVKQCDEGWFGQAKSWFLGLFGTNTCEKKSKKTKRNHAITTDTTQTANNNCCAAGACCDVSE